MIGPSFFKNENEETVKVNSVRTFFFWFVIDQHNLDNVWSQKEGATCHITSAKMSFIAREISRTRNWRLQLLTEIIGFDTVGLLFARLDEICLFMRINLLEH